MTAVQNENLGYTRSIYYRLKFQKLFFASWVLGWNPPFKVSFWGLAMGQLSGRWHCLAKKYISKL